MKTIQRERKKKGLTQSDLAQALGVDPSTVTKWETTETYPRAEQLPKLAKLLGCTIDDLYATEPKENVG